MDVSNVSDDVVAIQEFLEANVALVVPLPSMAFHVTTKFGFGVETEATNLRNMKATL